MQIGIVGTGAMARALGPRWIAAGQAVQFAGRSPARAREAATSVGARAVDLADAARGADALVVAVPASAVLEALTVVRGVEGAVLIDVTNPVQHGTGVLLRDHGSVAGQIADHHGGRVVKGFNLLPADVWSAPAMPSPPPTVPLAGDDSDAVETASALVRDAGGVPVVVGGLSRARQLEEAAGFVIALAFAGIDPRTAVPAAP